MRFRIKRADDGEGIKLLPIGEELKSIVRNSFGPLSDSNPSLEGISSMLIIDYHAHIYSPDEDRYQPGWSLCRTNCLGSSMQAGPYRAA